MITINVVCSKNREDLEFFEEPASLQDQVEEVRLQDKLGKQKYHQKTTKLFEPTIHAFKNTLQGITNTMTETSSRNNVALEDLNEKFLEKMNDRGIIASFLLSSLSKNTYPENTTQFKLVKIRAQVE